MPKKLDGLKIAQEIAQNKGGRCLSNTYIDNKNNLIWECSFEHTWRATLNNVKNHNRWCPYCALKKLDGLSAAQEIASKRNGKCLSTTYVNVKSYMTWQCKSGHIWKATLANVKNHNRWCPECAPNKKLDGLSVAQEIAISKNGECLSTKYVNIKSQMQWKCEKGHTWFSTLDSAKKGSWCPDCFGNKKLNGLSIAQEIASSRNGKCLSSKYINSDQPILWECSKKHTWGACLSKVKNSQTWCPYCSGHKGFDGLKIANEIAKSHNGKCLSDTYEDAHVKMKWQCEKGHIWVSNINNISRGCWCPKCKTERTKQTNLKKYGVENPMQNIDIALKSARKALKSQIVRNWETNEEQICVGSYEYKTALYLNANKISYKWQPKVFKIPNINKTYRPDLYLIDTDTWIEIKGYMRPQSQTKWDWFHSTYLNSDLWNKDKLKQLEIL